jgi:4-hydroxy-3-polyprenylbenzoate decarboxylase
MSRVLVAITGASGAIYGVRLVQRLVEHDVPTDVVCSSAGARVLGIEHGLPANPEEWFPEGAPQNLAVYANDDIAAPPASGSHAPRAMIVAPCSMGTLGRIACGISGNLIERCADVMLKERGRLVVVPRESPLSQIHLRNMLSLAESGAHIVPAMPAFYARPRDIEDTIAFVVDRALSSAGLDIPLRSVWREDAP